MPGLLVVGAGNNILNGAGNMNGGLPMFELAVLLITVPFGAAATNATFDWYKADTFVFFIIVGILLSNNCCNPIFFTLIPYSIYKLTTYAT